MAFYSALDSLVSAGYAIQALDLNALRCVALMERSGTIVARDAWKSIKKN